MGALKKNKKWATAHFCVKKIGAHLPFQPSGGTSSNISNASWEFLKMHYAMGVGVGDQTFQTYDFMRIPRIASCNGGGGKSKCVITWQTAFIVKVSKKMKL